MQTYRRNIHNDLRLGKYHRRTSLREALVFGKCHTRRHSGLGQRGQLLIEGSEVLATLHQKRGTLRRDRPRKEKEALCATDQRPTTSL